jgi:hypothetical protein
MPLTSLTAAGLSRLALVAAITLVALLARRPGAPR